MKQSILKRKIDKSSTLLDALKHMDREKIKLLLVFDGEIFIGILTIGDIQRAILANTDISSSIQENINTNKEYSFIGDPIEKVKKRMFQERMECMPVLDQSGGLVDLYSWDDVFDDNTEPSSSPEKLNAPVVIMAGGKGTRLKPLTNIIPKPMLPIGDKSILEVILDNFIKVGCSQFFLSVNYKSDILRYYLENLPEKYNITYFEEEKPLGTIGSVSMLKYKILSPFFVSNCDIIVDQDFRDVYDYHVNNNNEITIITALKNIKIAYGVIKTKTDGILDYLSEKPELTYQINTGVYILNPDLIKQIPENTYFHITDLITKVKEKGARVGCFPVSEKSWLDIGEWDEYLNYIRKELE
jgi:dTDP-glucose pyrophosphorylase